VDAADENKPHHHSGVLKAYTGKQIGYSLKISEVEKLDRIEPVVVHETVGKGGRAMVIQDIAAPPQVCAERIQDLGTHPLLSPPVESYE